MNTEAYGTTVFCDDIRHEVAGKMTLVGCYLAELNFNAPAPGILPTFAALVNLRIPTSVQFERLTIRVIKETDGEVEELFKTEINLSPDDKKKAMASSIDDGDAPRIVMVNFPVRWSPIEFLKPGFIKVRGYLDDDNEIQAGALKVNFPLIEAATDGKN